MSDVSIPGVNSKYNTDKMIEALVKVERLPLDRMKDDVKTLEATKKEWQDFNRLMTTVRNSARSLYNFDSPFNERTASSPDPGITPTASREAVEGITRVQVIQLAQADRFASNSLVKDQPIPDGNYTFQIGDESVSLRFRGGSVRDFADALSRRADGKIKASVIQNKPDSEILVIESEKTGAGWPLVFKDDAIKLGLDLGLIAEVKGASTDLLQPGKPVAVAPLTDLSIPVPSGFAITDSMVLEYQVRAQRLSDDQIKPAPKPEGPQVPAGPGASLRDVSLPDIQSQVPLPDWKAPEKPPEVKNDQMVFAKLNTGESPLPDVADSNDFVTVQVPISKLGNSLSAVTIHNKNSQRELDIQSVRVFDPASRGKYKAANPISIAQDARVSIEGIDIYRDTNTIKDAIPGVTLTLSNTTDRPVPIKVEPDRKLIKDKLIEFVANYNAVIREINIVTSRKDDTDVVTENDFLDDKQKEDDIKRLGMFQGEMTLNMIKSRFQNIVANAYKTEAGRDLAVLAQTGISTNASAGSGVNIGKLRGYLEINEKALDKALAEHFLPMKELFGYDTNGDLLPDSGVGVELEKYIMPYTQIGGLIPSKSSVVDGQIVAKNTEMKNYEVHMKDFEDNLKVKFGKMESALNRMQESSKSIESLNGSNKN